MGGSGSCLAILGCEGNKLTLPLAMEDLGPGERGARPDERELSPEPGRGGGTMLFLMTGAWEELGRPVGPTL